MVRQIATYKIYKYRGVDHLREFSTQNLQAITNN